MNQFLIQQKIELLDRKYEFLMKSSPKSFAFDLVSFINFFNEDEIIRYFTEKLHNEFRKKKKFYLSQSKTRGEELESYFDGSNLASTEKSKYKQIFDDNHKIVENTLNSRNLEKRLEDNLQTNFHLTFRINSEDSEITSKLNEFASAEEFEANLFRQLWTTSPGRALDDLELLSFYIHSEFKPKNFDWKLKDDIENSISDKLNKEYLSNLFIPEKSKNIITLIKEKVKRVYEAIRQEIGSTRLRLQILDKYKIRSQWYNRKYLRSLPEKRNIEEPLTRDLALYFFEQGITVWYRVKAGQHEYDLIHPEANNPFLTEVKAYKNSSTAKREIMKGFRQIHSYLSTYESHIPSCEGYLVIFRLGSAIYELPAKISTQRFTIYPMLIDIADSSESGSRQPKPIQITEQEILKELGKSSEEKQS